MKNTFAIVSVILAFAVSSFVDSVSRWVSLKGTAFKLAKLMAKVMKSNLAVLKGPPPAIGENNLV
jgi:hypothetical protein